MPDSGKRFAIRMADGMYSNGPRQRPVPLNKAKLWTNIGHLKNHLNGLTRSPYPPSAEVVEVQVVYQETKIGTVLELVAEAEAREKKRRDESEDYYARIDLEAARRRLAEAEERAKRRGIR